jgi:hypothetical protein
MTFAEPFEHQSKPRGLLYQFQIHGPQESLTQSCMFHCQSGNLSANAPRKILKSGLHGIIRTTLFQPTMMENIIAPLLPATNPAAILLPLKNAPTSKTLCLFHESYLYKTFHTDYRLYSKYLDSHLKPYRCKVPTCMDAQLHFSSNACLFRHEREAHGFHGHGDNPHLCLFEGCDRAIPGNGFPRRWNLYDHMKRVHDYTASESSGSPEDASAPTASPTSSKKDSTTRKRKVTRPISGSQTMKRTRSTQSSPVTTSKSTGSNNSTQRLKIAERNYLNCRTRLLEELSNIIPQDAGMHDKANANLQELITLGLHYRRIEASSAAAQLSNGVAD